MRKLNKVDPKNTRMIIIGSLGGNDALRLMNKDYANLLAPGGEYYENTITPFMKKLKDLSNRGVRVKFFGLPYGSQRNTPQRQKARAAVDLSLATAAQEYDVDYVTVYNKTREIKGKIFGVHYNGSRREAYRNHLAQLIGGKQPIPGEQLAYMRGDKGAYIRRNSFLIPYLAIKKAGFDFNLFYKDLEELFPGKVGAGKKILPIHGKDFIFGPEHFAALKLLAKKSKNTKYANLVRLKKKKETT